MIWPKAWSWSKVKWLLECPRQMQYFLERKPITSVQVNYWTELGHRVQRIFEMYFNQGINLRLGGDREEVFEKVMMIAKQDPFLTGRVVTCPVGKTEADLDREVVELARNGFKIFKEQGLLKCRIASEKGWRGQLRDLPLFGGIDFIVEGKRGDLILDGKGNRNMDADERQVQHYALVMTTSGRTILGGGLVYWRHKYVEVDVSPASLKRYVDESLGSIIELMRSLRKGRSEDLPATPTTTLCHRCSWKFSCGESLYRRPETVIELGEEVSL